jgi:hypothetical protein
MAVEIAVRRDCCGVVVVTRLFWYAHLRDAGSITCGVLGLSFNSPIGRLVWVALCELGWLVGFSTTGVCPIIALGTGGTAYNKPDGTTCDIVEDVPTQAGGHLLFLIDSPIFPCFFRGGTLNNWHSASAVLRLISKASNCAACMVTQNHQGWHFANS